MIEDNKILEANELRRRAASLRVARLNRFTGEPKLAITKRITGTWGEDVWFFDRFPKWFGGDGGPEIRNKF